MHASLIPRRIGPAVCRHDGRGSHVRGAPHARFLFDPQVCPSPMSAALQPTAPLDASARALCQTAGAPQSSYPRCRRCFRRHRDDLRGRAAHLLYTVIRGVPKELKSGRARTNHGCGSGLQAGDLALGATPAGQDDAGAGFVSVGPRGLGSASCARTHCLARKAMFVSPAAVCRAAVGQSETGYPLSGSGPAAHAKTRGPRRTGFAAVGGRNPGFVYILGLMWRFLKALVSPPL